MVGLLSPWPMQPMSAMALASASEGFQLELEPAGWSLCLCVAGAAGHGLKQN